MGIVVEQRNSGNFAIAPEGLTLSVLCEVQDLGPVESAWGLKRYRQSGRLQHHLLYAEGFYSDHGGHRCYRRWKLGTLDDELQSQDICRGLGQG